MPGMGESSTNESSGGETSIKEQLVCMNLELVPFDWGDVWNRERQEVKERNTFRNHFDLKSGLGREIHRDESYDGVIVR